MNEVDFFDFSQKIEAKKVVETTKYEILNSLVQQCRKTDFRAKLYPDLSGDELKEVKLKRPELKVLIIDEILDQAQRNNWNLCKSGGFSYLYNGAFWESLTDEDIKHFLSNCSERFGVKRVTAKEWQFVDDLFRQFLFSAFIQPPEFRANEVLINLKNGTFEVTKNGQSLRDFSDTDFLTYQLPFDYSPNATAPTFIRYLDRVLPDKSAQDVLSEYVGYLFIRHGNGLKLEKCLILYGNGANGKSVFAEIIQALIGKENIATTPLELLTNPQKYNAKDIVGKILNYDSDISAKIASTAMFKVLVSGEPITVEEKYKQSVPNVTNYAKFIFNANQLPTDVEQTNAFFRRFLIVPFDVTIPDDEQDKELHKKIIDNELSGVFNWVLSGLERLLINKKFTYCQSADDTLKAYQTESDSVKMFLDEKDYRPSNTGTKLLKDIYIEYKGFCLEEGYRACGNKEFSKRLRNVGYEIFKGAGARKIYIDTKTNDPLPF